MGIQKEIEHLYEIGSIVYIMYDYHPYKCKIEDIIYIEQSYGIPPKIVYEVSFKKIFNTNKSKIIRNENEIMSKKEILEKVKKQLEESL